ncbi:M48 family metallopeptidase [Sulfurimonas sp. MAG313]|nr:M48 family metallopeptidase [Sulfurimonas sp. MAG313]
MALGGIRVNRNTKDNQKKRLLNVVEEMSIASGISVPPVYLLPENSINAFAAGHTTDDVAIGVTQGLIDTLNREELQGVIAHEFSHIFNGDMKINMRLTGGLHGVLLIGLIGEGILRVFSRSRHTTHRRSSSKENNGGIIIIMLVGGAFYVIGFLGKFMGGWIKAIISRKREYLADATAVQYTRYPEGIAGALKKIGALSSGSTLNSDAATTHSHLFFAQGVSGFFTTMFSTHPPLDKRILAIEPRWNGVYPILTQNRAEKEKSHYSSKNEKKKQKKEKLSAIILAQSAIQSIATPKDKHIDFAKLVDEELSSLFGDSIGDALGAQGIVFSLLAHQDKDILNRQKSILSVGLVKELESALENKKSLKREHYLELVRLLIPTLKSLSLTQYKAFKSYMTHFIEIDKKVSTFEWCLQHILLRPLDRKFNITKPIKMLYSSIDAVKNETELLLSMLSQIQYKDETEAKNTFTKVMKVQGLPAFAYVKKEHINFKTFTQSVLALEKAKFGVKKRILEIILAMMMVDENLTLRENEMIQTMAEILQVPLPPLSA